MSTTTVELTLNGIRRRFACVPRETLGDALRIHGGVRGLHLGCEHGICGACTVEVDGRSVRSCLMFAVQADGAEVRTVEGLSEGAELHPLQKAFSEHHALQCGFCTPGILITALEMLGELDQEQRVALDEHTVRHRLAGNICRCTGYQNIIDAVLAYATQREQASTDQQPDTIQVRKT